MDENMTLREALKIAKSDDKAIVQELLDLICRLQNEKISNLIVLEQRIGNLEKELKNIGQLCGIKQSEISQ